MYFRTLRGGTCRPSFNSNSFAIQRQLTTQKQNLRFQRFARFKARARTAVRYWARTSESVRIAVAAVDQRRIAILEQIFKDMGPKPKKSMVARASCTTTRWATTHWGVQESRKKRRELLPYYHKVLTGRDQ